MWSPINSLAGLFKGHISVCILLIIALVTRLPFLSISLDEVDSGNFYNALKYGYDIANFRPHAPGYPLYVFLGWLLNYLVRDYLICLTLLSAILGSFSVLPFHLILRQIVGYKVAFCGSLLFLANPLYWAFSETALADVPAVFLGTLSVWLMHKGMTDRNYYMAACFVTGLAIGIRQANITLMLLLVLVGVYVYLDLKRTAVKQIGLGTASFVLGIALWFIPAVLIGTAGVYEYVEVISRQWSSVVSVSDASNLESPWILNLLYRIERFFLAYHLLYSWTGSDSKSAVTILLIAPWLFGFLTFLSTFRVKDRSHLFIMVWILLSLYPILSIHFLPRYGLPYLPAFMIASILGFQHVFLHERDFRRGLEVGGFCILATVLMLYVIKHQPPVDTFEVTPPLTNLYVCLLLLLSVVTVVICRWRRRTRHVDIIKTVEGVAWCSLTSPNIFRLRLFLIVLFMMVLPYGILGIGHVSVAHNTSSPSQKLVSLVETNYNGIAVTFCWDNQTHSLFEASDSSMVRLLGQNASQDLYESYQAGGTLLMSDRCQWLEDLNEHLNVTEVASFKGKSLLWDKVPAITLYEAKDPQSY